MKQTGIIFLLLFFLGLSKNWAGSLITSHGKFELFNTSVQFIENKGQLNADENDPSLKVYYYTSNPAFNIYITNRGLTYVFSEPSEIIDEQVTAFRVSRIDMLLDRSHIRENNISAVNGSGQGYYNYYISGDKQPYEDIKAYQRVRVEDIYPGIDWEIYTDGKNVKYDFVVKPNADANQIKIKYKGADRLLERSDNELEIHSPLGKILEGKLYCYQPGSDVKLSSSYQKEGDFFKIHVDSYDHTKPLVIDPPLTWATYYSGTDGSGDSEDIAVDKCGNVYIVGHVTSSSITNSAFPTYDKGTGAYYQDKKGGASTCVIAKFNVNGVRQWATFYSAPQVVGTNQGTVGLKIAIDTSDNIFICGWTVETTNFPSFDPGGGAWFKNTNMGGHDFMILKFNCKGQRKWATLFGGSKEDDALAIKTDISGNVYVAGYTLSNDMPLMDPGGNAYFQNTMGDAFMDAYIAKFNNNGVFLWGSYYGGSALESFHDIAIDGNEDVYITGYTRSADFPVLDASGGAYFNNIHSGGQDAVLIKFDKTGVRQHSTLLGGNKNDIGEGVAIDNTGNVFVVGTTTSADFKTVDPASGAYFQASSGSPTQEDLFITKFLPNLSLYWSTYYGGNNAELLSATSGHGGIVCDKNNNIHVAGSSRSSNFPTFDPGSGSYFNGTYGGDFSDIIYLSFDPSLKQRLSTYWGADKTDNGTGVAAFEDCVFISGASMQNGNTVDPGNGAWYQSNNAHAQQWRNPVLLKLGNCENTYSHVTQKNNASCNQSNGSASVAFTGCSNPVTYLWQPSGGTSATASGLAAGTYTVTITDPCGNVFEDTVVIETSVPEIDSIPPVSACEGDVVTLKAMVSGDTIGYNFNWDGTFNGNPYLVTVKDSASYRVIVTDSFGCKDTAYAVVNVITSVKAQTIPDTSLCAGDTIQLFASGGTSYSWQPSVGLSSSNVFNPLANPSATTTYTVIVKSSSSCPSDTDEVIVAVIPPVVAATGSSYILCNGDSVQLVASGGSIYSWSPSAGLNSSSIPNPVVIPANSITYTVTVGSIPGCPTDTAIYTITMVSQLTANAGEDTTICEGSQAQLTASGGKSYEWNTGDITQTISVTPAVTTNYTVVVKSGSCPNDTDEVTVNITPLPMADAGTDTSINIGSEVTLLAGGAGAYNWSPSIGLSCTACPSPLASPSLTTTYILTVTLNGCKSTDTITVTVVDNCGDLFIPNAFSPNSDGMNDLFLVRNNCIKEISIIIYDRWGQKVFESNDPLTGWDGRFNGINMDAGVFKYVIDAVLLNKENVFKKGNVNLVR